MKPTLCGMSGLAVAVIAGGLATAAFADAGHSSKEPTHSRPKSMLEQMRDQHSKHEHEHDFEVMKKMTPKQMSRIVALMQDVGLTIPKMDAERGRKLFVETGCIVCHTVNKVGGDIGPDLSAENMPSPMNAFEFAARMWRGAASMTAMQEDILGGVISLTGQDLADLIAFAHDKNEQKELKVSQIPKKFRKIMTE